MQFFQTGAEAEYLACRVAGVSLVLKQDSGERVETLPAATASDFIQLTEVTRPPAPAGLFQGPFASGLARSSRADSEIVAQDHSENPIEVPVVDTQAVAWRDLDTRLCLTTRESIRTTGMARMLARIPPKAGTMSRYER